VHRWAAGYVTTGNTEPPTDAANAEIFDAPGTEHLLEWYRAQHAALVEALAAADPALTCWTFLPAPSPLAFWARRQAHETAIHRVDAEAANSSVTASPPAFSVDGIDELLNGFLSRPRGRLVADPPRTVAVQATDVDAAWTVHIEPDRRRVVAGRQAADLTVTGSASDLYYLLWNRCDTARLDVRGDDTILDLWRHAATIRWR
jgi:uncharacterized protein (TIGR03083 family)